MRSASIIAFLGKQTDRLHPPFPAPGVVITRFMILRSDKYIEKRVASLLDLNTAMTSHISFLLRNIERRNVRFNIIY